MPKLSGEITLNYQWAHRRPDTAGGLAGFITRAMIPRVSMQVGAVFLDSEYGLIGYLDGSGTEPDAGGLHEVDLSIENGRKSMSSAVIDLDTVPDAASHVVFVISSFNGARLYETDSNAVTIYRDEQRVVTYTVPLVDESNEDGYGGVEHFSSAAVYMLSRQDGGKWATRGLALPVHGRSVGGCAVEVGFSVRDEMGAAEE